MASKLVSIVLDVWSAKTLPDCGSLLEAFWGMTEELSYPRIIWRTRTPFVIPANAGIHA
jgi:hypothetical protein